VAPGRRERGSFAEPSILGMFIAMSLAYLVSAVVRAPALRRVFYGVLILAGLYLYAVSYTGTALISLGATAAAGLVVTLVVLLRRFSRRQLVITGISAVLVLAVVGVAWPLLEPFTAGLVEEKLTTSSFDNRGLSNWIAWGIFLQSFGLGIGFGSNRPSSFLFMLISCGGVIGTLTYLRASLAYMFGAWFTPAYRAVAWAALAVLVAQVVAKPDLSMPFLWILLGLCAIPYAERARERQESDEGRLKGLVPGLHRLTTGGGRSPLPAPAPAARRGGDT